MTSCCFARVGAVHGVSELKRRERAPRAGAHSCGISSGGGSGAPVLAVGGGALGF
jgi:hypothetical protein